MFEIVHYPHPILRQQAEPITQFDASLRDVIASMIETMYRNEGVGLAAPQIGISCRLIVIDEGNGSMALINPIVSPQEGAIQERMEEGCLSLPDIRVDVIRPSAVRVEAIDPRGEAIVLETEGLLARIIQHEVDHLNGVLIIDRTSPVQRRLIQSRLRRLEKSFIGSETS